MLASFCTKAQINEKWHIFQLEDLNYEKSNSFLNTPTLASNIEITSKNYTLKSSKYDRVVFVMQGNSLATLGMQEFKLKASDVLFLKANDVIYFKDELKLLLWTSKSTKTEHDFKSQVFSEDKIRSQKDENENIWNRFIENATMNMGLYMLPKSLNGDATLNHEVDEINLVRCGTAKFKMNDTIIDVKPGTIMWVKSGVGHYFYDLSEDFDVYILFENH